MTDVLKDLLSRFTTNIIALTFCILGIAVLLDIYIIKDELTKLVIYILGLASTLILISNIFTFIKKVGASFFEKKKNKDELIESFKSLNENEMKYIYKSYKEDKNRFSFFDIAGLLQAEFFIQVKELDDDNLIVKLNPIIKKHLDKVS